MITSRLPQKRRKRRPGLHFLFIFTATTVMVATGGFGAFPDNPLTQTFREVIGENIPADFLNPFNSYMESISAPRIPPQPASASENDSPPDPLGFFEDLFGGDDPAQMPPPGEAAFIETAMASIEETQTQSVLLTSTASSPISTQSLAPTGTQAFTPTFTLVPTATDTVAPTWTALPVYVNPTSTKKPTPVDTPSITPFLGFEITAVDINNAGSNVTVSPGDPVNVLYAFNVYNDPCPGCATQLVAGIAGSHFNTCGFDGDAGLLPGTSGVEEPAFTAPLLPGVYSIVVEYYWEPDCASALSLYGTGANQQAPSQVIGQITVPPPTSLVLYEGGLSDGYVGGGSGVDSICAANLPPGRNFYGAFLSINSGDYLSIMPTFFSFPANVPIYSPSNILIANDWADLMDGTIATTLSAAGVTNNPWWSGSDDASGSTVDGVTLDCNDWTSNLGTVFGNFGDPNSTGPSWVTQSPSIVSSCDAAYAVICVGW